MKQAITNIFYFCITLTIFSFLSGCASIVSKSVYPLTINSKPSDARLSITDKKGKEIYLGRTPAKIDLKSGSGFFTRAEYLVKLSSPGYDDRIIPVTFSLDGWYWGNLLLGGVLGMLIIDPATGAMWKLEKEFIDETLTKSTASLDAQLNIIDLNEIPTAWKGHIIKVK